MADVTFPTALPVAQIPMQYDVQFFQGDQCCVLLFHEMIKKSN